MVAMSICIIAMSRPEFSRSWRPTLSYILPTHSSIMPPDTYVPCDTHSHLLSPLLRIMSLYIKVYSL